MVGIRLPVMMGVTFAAVGPMLAIADDVSLGDPTMHLLTIFGSAIAAGVFTILVAPIPSHLLPLFPPVVNGSIILLGISLMRVGMNQAAGAPSYGNPFNLGVAAFVLVVIPLITRFARGFFGTFAVLMGIPAGSLACLFLFATMDFSKAALAPWFAVILPFRFGVPASVWCTS